MTETTSRAPGLWLTLRLRDVDAMTDWLRAIGFTELATYRDDGVVVHAEYLWPAGGGVMFGAHRGDTDWSQQPGVAAAYLVTDRVDEVHAAAVAAGATVLYAPRDPAHGGREGAVRDPEGNIWSFGTYAPGE